MIVDYCNTDVYPLIHPVVDPVSPHFVGYENTVAILIIIVCIRFNSEILTTYFPPHLVLKITPEKMTNTTVDTMIIIMATVHPIAIAAISPATRH